MKISIVEAKVALEGYVLQMTSLSTKLGLERLAALPHCTPKSGMQPAWSEPQIRQKLVSRNNHSLASKLSLSYPPSTMLLVWGVVYKKSPKLEALLLWILSKKN